MDDIPNEFPSSPEDFQFHFAAQVAMSQANAQEVGDWMNKMLGRIGKVVELGEQLESCNFTDPNLITKYMGRSVELMEQWDIVATAVRKANAMAE